MTSLKEKFEAAAYKHEPSSFAALVEKPVLADKGGEVFDAGKHSGKAFKEVLVQDPAYFYFLFGQQTRLDGGKYRLFLKYVCAVLECDESELKDKDAKAKDSSKGASKDTSKGSKTTEKTKEEVNVKKRGADEIVEAGEKGSSSSGSCRQCEVLRLERDRLQSKCDVNAAKNESMMQSLQF